MNPQRNEHLSSFCIPRCETLRTMATFFSGVCHHELPRSHSSHAIVQESGESLSFRCSRRGRSGTISSAKHEGHRKSTQTHLALVSRVTKVIRLDTQDQAGLLQGR